MKKLMALLVGIIGIVPFVANAEETTNFYKYDAGQIVNFYGNETNQNARNGLGIETIIVEDKGTSAEFVEAWLVGEVVGTSIGNTALLKDDFKTTDAYATLRNAFATADILPATGASHYDYLYDLDDAEMGLRIPTIADMVTLFGAVKTDGAEEYTFPHLTEKTLVDRNGQAQSLLEELDRVFGAISDCAESARNGVLLADRVNVTSSTNASNHAGAKYWLIKFTYDTAGKITDAKIVTEEWNPADATMRAIAPIAYVNKTADCHEETTPEYMCYVCGDEYSYIEKGTQGAGCKAVPGVTNAADCVKKVCYKCKTDEENKFKFIIDKFGKDEYATCEVVADSECNTKTGKKSYVLEFAIVAALCAISLLVVKRKDLFRTI